MIIRCALFFSLLALLFYPTNAEVFTSIADLQRLFQAEKDIQREDLKGAAMSLLRLQDTYRLHTRDLANGIVGRFKTGKEFSASDCFEVGRLAFNNEDYYHTLLWMDEAMERSKRENPLTAAEAGILEHLALALYKQGNLKRALLATDRLYELMPDHPRAQVNIKWCEDQLLAMGVRRAEFRRNVPPLTNFRSTDYMQDSERNIYEALCRNEVPVNAKETSGLYCYYKRDRPFLRVAPFKVEILRFSPLVVMFRDVISDDEIEVIQQLAGPKLARAVVQNSQTEQSEPAAYRISKSAWLKDEDHEVVARVSTRMEQMTNLKIETAEKLQIANYGIGGHYEPHIDFAPEQETHVFDRLGTGNRIATVLFYMSQPEAGGATAFTDVQTTVMPSKNDALFWYNLMRSGEGDFRTRHAACPVLLGSKWSSNAWIHEAGQEFRRPCGLTPSVNERYVGDLGGSEPRNHPNLSPY
ncbi:Procollagen-proline 4-dioxygenase [Aphelenchoides fujianensis]|nr:Procollagen-proline 4-dioxygenase [Aphelenchoides fujianensis]